MTGWWGAHRLRMRLTLWHLAVMAVVLGAYATAVYGFATRNVSAALDQQLRLDYQWGAAVVTPQPDGSFACPLCEELESDALTIAFDSGRGLASSPWLQVWSLDGTLLYASAEAQRSPVERSGELARRAAARDGIISVAAPQGPMRVVTSHDDICPPGTMRGMLNTGGVTCLSEAVGEPDSRPVAVVIQAARSEAPMRAQVAELVLILALGLPLSLVIAGVGGYTLARRALAPIDEMAARARTITADRLHDRLPVDHPDDEMGRLATVFNETLGRLESSFEQMRRFTADVSHELRTPLTAIQSVGEVGLRETRDAPAYRRIIGSMLEEVDRLSRLVNRLLVLSRAETEAVQAHVETVALRPLVEEVGAHLGVLAEEKQQAIVIEGGAGLACLGERLVLRQALINLVHNAIKYGPAGGRVRITLSRLGDRVVIDVSDPGPGIPESLRPRLFDRFARGDDAGQTGGIGLGLSIARRSVEACGGRLSLERSGPDGTTFRISLPLAEAAALRAS